ESLGAGVESTDQEGPGLPKVGRDLNWVVVAQRFPVWIRLDNPPTDALHVGMTASVKVRHVPAGDVTAAAAPVGTR
ncbi:MAG: multidrug resistance efflux pump HlyD, partial [Gammaproteobacteria bacterium]|nr:multidrug resistance efflux pump HlyD [Gammaproteobacteria bacterium]